MNFQDFNTDSNANDVSLVKLASDVVYNDFVRPICLPSASERFDDSVVCYSTGWGFEGTKNVISILNLKRCQ